MELRTARKIARLTQRELSERSGVDEASISKVESGEKTIATMQYQLVVRLARALNVEPDELFPVSPVASVTPATDAQS